MISLFKHFIKDQSGAHIIEVAIVFSVLMTLIMGAVEFGLIMYASSLLDTITAQAARYGKTGHDYGSGSSETFTPDSDEGFSSGDSGDYYTVNDDGSVSMNSREAFIRNYIRQTGSALLSPEHIRVTTSLFSTITSAGIAGPTSTPYNFGGGKDAVVYHVHYDWPILTPLMLPFGEKGKFPIESVMVVQNEDY